MIIVGAGMAGLLAGAVLRDRASCIIESQPSIPNNHSAVLRFRSRTVSDAVNVPFRKVDVIKATAAHKNPVADAMLYSLKTNGTATLRSISSISAAPEISSRYIAPEDFIQQLANKVSCEFRFNTKFHPLETEKPIISTMPMPSLMNLLGWKTRSQFRWRDGVNVIVKLQNVEAFCSLYVPNPVYDFARISITGSELVAECYGPEFDEIDEFEVAEAAISLCGLDLSSISSVEKKRQRYGKILPIDESERKEFIMWASQSHSIYSLGRFATWRPGLLLDDIVDDIRIIQKLVDQKGETYAHKLRF